MSILHSHTQVMYHPPAAAAQYDRRRRHRFRRRRRRRHVCCRLQIMLFLFSVKSVIHQLLSGLRFFF